MSRDTAKLPHVIVIPDRIAWRVFDPRPGGPNAGNYFIRMPDGTIFLRPAEKGGSAVRELLQFSRLIKIAEGRRVRLAAASAPAVRPAFRAAPVNIAPQPLQAFFDDSTLSAGDVVVAAEGFRVFRGSQNFPWKASDFVTTERWQRDNGTRRGLREMERETARGR